MDFTALLLLNTHIVTGWKKAFSLCAAERPSSVLQVLAESFDFIYFFADKCFSWRLIPSLSDGKWEEMCQKLMALSRRDPQTDMVSLLMGKILQSYVIKVSLRWGQHGGVVVSDVTSQQEGPGTNPPPVFALWYTDELSRVTAERGSSTCESRGRKYVMFMKSAFGNFCYWRWSLTYFLSIGEWQT